MNSRVAQSALVLLAAGLLAGVWAQRGGRGIANPDDSPGSVPTASLDIGRAKADRELNIKDATRLAELADKVKHDLSAGSSYTLSLTTVRDADEMTKLSKRLYSRLKTGNPHPEQTPSDFDASRVGPPPKH